MTKSNYLVGGNRMHFACISRLIWIRFLTCHAFSSGVVSNFTTFLTLAVHQSRLSSAILPTNRSVVYIQALRLVRGSSFGCWGVVPASEGLRPLLGAAGAGATPGGGPSWPGDAQKIEDTARRLATFRYWLSLPWPRGTSRQNEHDNHQRHLICNGLHWKYDWELMPTSITANASASSGASIAVERKRKAFLSFFSSAAANLNTFLLPRHV